MRAAKPRMSIYLRIDEHPRPGVGTAAGGTLTTSTCRKSSAGSRARGSGPRGTRGTCRTHPTARTATAAHLPNAQDAARQALLGGSSIALSGRCLPLDPEIPVLLVSQFAARSRSRTASGLCSPDAFALRTQPKGPPRHRRRGIVARMCPPVHCLASRMRSQSYVVRNVGISTEGRDAR